MNSIDKISGNLAEMRLIAEGAISIFEKSPTPNVDAYGLIGEALYLLRDRIGDCLSECQESKPNQNF